MSPPPVDPASHLVSFSFLYDHNQYYEDRFEAEVDHIDFFLYDSEGNLYQQLLTDRTEMLPGHIIQIEDLPPGDYTVVTWGNTNNETYEHLETETLSTHKIHRACIEEGEVTEKEPEALFHAVQQFTITGDTIVPMEMVKNNNHLRFIIKGMRDDDRLWAEELLYARIESYNRVYNYDNSWGSEESISYIPHNYEVIEEEEEVVIEFHILQMSAEDTDTKIILRFQDSDSRLHFMEEPIIPNLRNQYVTPLANRSDQTALSFDEYVTRYDEFELYFYMEYEETIDGLAITIKPWDGISQPGDL